MHIAALTLLAVLAGPLPAPAAAPAREPTCRDSGLAWAALGALFGGLVGTAIFARGDEKPAALYVGAGVVVGGAAGYGLNAACRAERQPSDGSRQTPENGPGPMAHEDRARAAPTAPRPVTAATPALRYPGTPTQAPQTTPAPRYPDTPTRAAAPVVP